MAVETDADRLEFLDIDEFGVTANYDGGTTIQGIYDDEYYESLDVESSDPVFHCRTSDVSDAVHGKTLVVNATNYTVKGVEPDGTGFTLLRLEKV